MTPMLLLWNELQRLGLQKEFRKHEMIEDVGYGLYMHWIQCVECGYEDEVLSGDPNDPHV